MFAGCHKININIGYIETNLQILLINRFGININIGDIETGMDTRLVTDKIAININIGYIETLLKWQIRLFFGRLISI